MQEEWFRKEVFSSELYKLRREEFITEEEYQMVLKAYHGYYMLKDAKKEQSINTPIKDSSSKDIKLPQKKNAKKLLSPQEIREKNITGILIAGVILILLSGIILATSNWSAISNVAKTGLISLVAILFFGISIISSKFLKIEKTSFAFWVLGTLFLPVFVLSSGYFKLLGPYLSIFGEGKYLFGLMGTLVCLPMYIYSYKKYNHRLFLWFTYVDLTTTVYFLLASFKLSVDAFYFSITLYNLLLIGIYYSYKKKKIEKPFFMEFIVYIQVNLIFSTVLTLFFYENHYAYGINILLLSSLYILLTYYGSHREYAYVFSSLVIYGIYELVEFSPLFSMDKFLFSMVVMLFIVFERYLAKDDMLKKIFRYMNILVGFIVITYITIGNFTKGMNSSSVLTMLAFFIIAISYLYISNVTKFQLFSYVTTIVFLFGINEAFGLLRKQYAGNFASGFYFTVSMVMFLLLYYKNKNKYTICIKRSNGIISLIVMALSIFWGIYSKQYALASLELYLTSVPLYIIFKNNNKLLKGVCPYVLGVLWYLAGAFLYHDSGQYAVKLIASYDIPLHLFIACLLLYALAFIWGRYEKNIQKAFFYTGNIIMPFILLINFIFHMKLPMIFLVATMIYIYSLIKSEKEWQVKAFLYESFTLAIMTAYSVFQLLMEYGIFLDSKMIMGGATISIMILWYFLKEEWRNRTAWYLIPLSIVSSYIFQVTEIFNYSLYLLIFASILCCLYLFKYYKLQLLNLIPLISLLVTTNKFLEDYLGGSAVVSLVFLLTVLAFCYFVGNRSSHKLYGRDYSYVGFHIDWYFFICLILLLRFQDLVYKFYSTSLCLSLIAPLLLVYLVYSQRKRVSIGFPYKIVQSITCIATLVPYYVFLQKINVYSLYRRELVVLPWIILTIFISKYIWEGYEKWTDKIELGVIILVSLILLYDIFNLDLIEDALIFGTLSLISVIYGSYVRRRNYFLVGIVSLFINVLFQSRHFWGRLPWWVYLLIAGLILITLASFYEWQKNNKNNRVITKTKFKDWLNSLK